MRYEYKYIVHNSKMEHLRKMILPFVDVDQFAESGGKNQYTVRSIYFDTPGYDFYYEKVDGIKNRKKVRLRGYDEENDDNTVFFEIKRKYDIPIVKYRAPVTFRDAQLMLKEKSINGSVLFKDTFPKGTENAVRFFYQVFSKNLRPVVLIIYEREAYLSKFDSTVRITFDKNLRSKGYPSIQELYQEERIKATLADHFILEVKFNRSFPGWLNPMISQFSLRKQSASKYVISMDANKIVNRITKSKIYTRSKWFNS
ncbi:MAG: polyphosphate polymerase domain-containing protein [Bacteroidetes bacterium]|nr:polyphosphate polymerase domain-containing protein [Bacteroidota bacterium]MBL7104448.1 polyphosphate polymerase domain-containing protein [Bacteroidales bacterium]